MSNVTSINKARAAKLNAETHPDADIVHSMFVEDSDLSVNIGRRGRFVEEHAYNGLGEPHGMFTVIAVQNMWGHNAEGAYVPNIVGYRVVLDSDVHKFGKPALVETVILD